MGFILKFVVIVFGILFLLSVLLGASTVHQILRLLFRGRKKSQNKDTFYNKKPPSQNERIITYKKKEFETSAAEDVDFVEIKDDDK